MNNTTLWHKLALFVALATFIPALFAQHGSFEGFLKPKEGLKVLLHYTWRAGDPGAAGDGATVNEYFYQSGVGAIRRGNWIGLGINAIF